MKMTIRKKLFLAFALIIVLMVGLGAYALTSIGDVKDRSEEIMSVWFLGVDLAHGIDTEIADYRGKEYRHLMLKTDSEMAAIEQEMQTIREDIHKNLQDYLNTAVLEEDQKLAKALATDLENYFTISEQVRSLSKQNKDQEAEEIMMGASLTQYLKVGESAQTLVAFNQQNGEAAHIATAETYQTSRIVLIATIAIIAVISALIAFVVGRSISVNMDLMVGMLNKTAALDLQFDEATYQKIQKNKNRDEIVLAMEALVGMRKSLREIVEQLKGSSGQLEGQTNMVAQSIEETSTAFEGIAQATDELAKGATEQARNAQEGAEKLNNLAQKINISVADSQDIKRYVDEANDANDAGNEAIEVLKRIAQDNIAIVSAVGDQIATLEHKSKSIGNITGTIKSIATQTNLLALNAMIESARAGEAGRGFAVVAEEIRKLAEEVTNNVKEIEQTTSDIAQEIGNTKQKIEETKVVIGNSVKVSNDTGDKFQAISETIEHIIASINNMAKSIMAVAQDKDRVVHAIEEISAITEESSASTEEISASIQQQTAVMEEITGTAQEMKAIAELLKGLVEKFEL